MRRGEVWWGAAALAGGSAKERPFLVVSRDAFNRNDAYRKVMVVHLTSAEPVGGPYDWEVRIPRGTAGLRKASVAKCAEIYTFLKSDLTELSGTLPSALMSEVDAALALALGLS